MCRGPHRKVSTVLRMNLPRGSEDAPGVAEVHALLIDMDGTLVDSDAVVERSWSRWAEANGIDPQAVIAVCHGATADATITRFRPDLSEAEVAATAQEHMEIETNDVEGVVPKPGALDLVAWLDSQAVPWAVVTNASRPLAQARLGAAGISAPALVTVEEVPVGKPDPALYLLGAERLGVAVEHCLVVEDSGAGVAAGLAAGATVTALRRDDADVRIERLDDLLSLLSPA